MSESLYASKQKLRKEFRCRETSLRHASSTQGLLPIPAGTARSSGASYFSGCTLHSSIGRHIFPVVRRDVSDYYRAPPLNGRTSSTCRHFTVSTFVGFRGQGPRQPTHDEVSSYLLGLQMLAVRNAEGEEDDSNRWKGMVNSRK